MLGDDPKFTAIKEENDHYIASLRDKIVSGRSRFCSIKAETHRLEQARLDREEHEKSLIEAKRAHEEDLKIKDIILCANADYREIRMRSLRLTKKCEVNFDALTDHEILDLKKGEEGFHVELRELIDKVSSFEKLIMPCRDSLKDKHDEAIKMRELSITAVDNFVSRLLTDVKT